MKIRILWSETDGIAWVVPIRWLAPGRDGAMPTGLACRALAARAAVPVRLTTRQLMARLPGWPAESNR